MPEYKKAIMSVDLMGGDLDPSVRLHAIEKFIEGKKEEIDLRLFVTEQYLKDQKTAFKKLAQQTEIISSAKSVEMADSALMALKNKRHSSMSLAIKDVADGNADVVLTAGNTGAMVAFSKYWLKPLSDIDRPALATLLPSSVKSSLLLDVGATVDYRADDLFNLARMGSAAIQALRGDSFLPEVALLNIGVENLKGNDAVQQADHLLEKSDLNYLGFCEGSHLFNGFADVICCDGFVGNITLKACEAMMQMIHNGSNKNMFGKLLNKFNTINLNPSQYNGAMLLGLDGLVIKSHGNCDEFSFHQALNQAFINVNKQIILNMKNSMGE